VDYDFLIIGAGIAGAAAAFELTEAAPGARIAVVEREDTPGYHATGRSAALFVETYGGPLIRALVRGSRSFLETPPAGFAEYPLLGTRGVLHFAREGQRQRAEQLFADCRNLTRDLRLVEAGEIADLQPALRSGYAVCAVHEPHAMDIDVGALHQGFLRGFKARGGRLMTGAGVRAIERRGESWRIQTAAGHLTAGTVVNAAGAWADEIAETAGIAPLGLVPKRRTAITFDPPGGMAVARWPMTIDVDESLYFKPEAGRILASPCDETPMPPSDAQPDEWDVAVAVDRLQEATTLTVERIAHKWAGLRSFLADKLPAVGPDTAEPTFFWLAGQGGYGIKTAPALGRMAAALLTGGEIPADLADLGVTAAALGPGRFAGRHGTES
jgi:D-arginine dehydrogenase